MDKIQQFVLDECDKCLDKVDMRKEFPLGWDVETRGSFRAIYTEHFLWEKMYVETVKSRKILMNLERKQEKTCKSVCF